MKMNVSSGDRSTSGKRATILIAEDSKFDQMILRRAFAAAEIAVELRFVSDGEDLLTCLRGMVAAGGTSPLPAIVLMDLHMPRMGGREALRQIRLDERLRHLPIVMLTTSGSERHVRELYGIGANSYVVKPNTFEDVVATVRQLEQYWFGIARLPKIA
jgi:CheY-like chemotaxis protein